MQRRRLERVVEVGARDSLSSVLDLVARRVAGAVALEFDPLMREAEGAFQPMPIPPTKPADRSLRMSPNMFSVTSTSKSQGRCTIQSAKAST